MPIELGKIIRDSNYSASFVFFSNIHDTAIEKISLKISEKAETEHHTFFLSFPNKYSSHHFIQFLSSS